MQDDQLIESIIVEKLSSDEPREKIQEIFDICKNIKGETSCDTAFEVYECYVTNKSKQN